MTKSSPDYEDRLIDLALREKLGGRRPPDLSGRILSTSPGAGRTVERARRGPAAGRTLITWALSLGMLSLALALAWCVRPPQADSPAAGDVAALRGWDSKKRDKSKFLAAYPLPNRREELEYRFGSPHDSRPFGGINGTSSLPTDRYDFDAYGFDAGAANVYYAARPQSQDEQSRDEFAAYAPIEATRQIELFNGQSNTLSVFDAAPDSLSPADPQAYSLLDLEDDMQAIVASSSTTSWREDDMGQLVVAGIPIDGTVNQNRLYATSDFEAGFIPQPDSPQILPGRAHANTDLRVIRLTEADAGEILRAKILLFTDGELKDAKLAESIFPGGKASIADVVAPQLEARDAQLAALSSGIARGRAVLRYAQSDRSVPYETRERLAGELKLAQRYYARLAYERDRLALAAGLPPRAAEDRPLAALAPRKAEAPAGQVTTVGRRGLVEISLAGVENVTAGKQLEIFREEEYVGRVLVRRVDGETAVAEILNEQQNTEPRAGDRAVARDDLPQKPISTWRRATATTNAARLVIGERDELPPQGMQASVVIDGFRARIVLDYYFYNDRDSPLEGSFRLRLPDEASLFYFAFGETAYEYRPLVDSVAANGFLDVELVRSGGSEPADIFEQRRESFGAVKEARMVPREKAAYAYGETVRKRIDPALVEWAGAGVFNAKVFPLAPGKLHRIVVGYDVGLAHEGDDLVYRFPVPGDLEECRVDVSVDELPGVNISASPEQKPYRGSNGRRYYHYHELAEDETEVAVRLSDPGVLLLTGEDAATGDYFAAEVAAPLTGEQKPAAGSPRAVFLLDTSLSSHAERFNLWIDLLAETLEQNRPELAEFAVLIFNVEARWWREEFVANTPENAAALLADLRELSLEGATDLGLAIEEGCSPAWLNDRPDGEEGRCDLFLLSDGGATWGESSLHRIAAPLAAAGRLFAYKTGMSGTAGPALDFLARESGGAVFAIAGEEEIASAATAHRTPPWQLASVAVDGGSDVLVAGRPQAVYPGQRLLVVGRGKPGLDSQVRLELKREGERKSLSVPLARRVDSVLATRAYGQVAAGELEELADAAEETAIAYARHFRITGQTCSLLMLESEEDYQRFEINPEDDATLVRERPAAEFAAAQRAEAGDRLADPRLALLDRLKRLTDAPGIEFQLSESLREAIEKLPAESFDVVIPRLDCNPHAAQGMPTELAAHLDERAASGEPLDYDLVTVDARRRLEEAGAADALKCLSSLVENSPGDTVLARDVAFSALEWNLPGQAYPLLVKVAALRPYEPPTWPAIARSLAELGRPELAIIYYEVAVGAGWDERFGEASHVAAAEYLRLLARVRRGEVKCELADFADSRWEELSTGHPALGADLVVTMAWNTDRTDVDLHVAEPSGEVCKYDHADTAAGGHITRDVTGGYGPELYTLPSAPAGDYHVRVHYFGADASRTSTRTRVFVTTYENFAEADERVATNTITLGDQQEEREVATIGKD